MNPEEENSLLSQFGISLGTRIGITVCGQFDESDEFYPEYYYPYLEAIVPSTDESITTERRLDHNAFVGIVEDYRVGATLIYRVQNGIDCLRHLQLNPDALVGATTSLTALSMEGKVLLPINKSSEERLMGNIHALDRSDLVRKAVDGDEKAYQALTIADMETYQNISTHLLTEDIYTLVDSYLMPTGIEGELYQIMGDIYGVDSVTNRITGEEVVILTLEVNGINIDIAINRKDLYGEPRVGRRFKGKIWMQGRIDFAGEGDEEETI